MRSKSLAAILFTVGITAQETGKLGDAAPIFNNPVGDSYIANLPSEAFDAAAFPNGGNIQGSVQAVASPDGQGVMFQLKLFNLPREGGPFLYHLHDQPVPANGNCSGTLAHLDPYERGEMPKCDSSRPETCQVGDLSGKHGPITSDPFNATFTDMFASTLPGIGAFFANRSIAVHFANTTRITCANFSFVETGDDGEENGFGPGSGTNPLPTSTILSTTRLTDSATTSLAVATDKTNTTEPRTSSTIMKAAAPANFPATMLGIGAAVLVLAL